MNKPTRILTAILVSLLLGGMFAYQDAQKNDPAYQQHPVTVVLTDFFCGSLAGLICYLGSGWLARRKERKLNQAEGDKFYDEVARELQEKTLVAGLWTKAYAEMGGDDAKARALYNIALHNWQKPVASDVGNNSQKRKLNNGTRWSQPNK
jgi:hypothetical protein